MSHQSRRRFLQAMAGLGASGAGLALLAGCSRLSTQPAPPRGEASLETTRIRLPRATSACQAPIWLADDLLRAEGFTDVEYVAYGPGIPNAQQALARGHVDVAMSFAGPAIIHVDAGDPIVFLAGIHPGCFELFAVDRVQAIRDLRGGTIAVTALGSAEHIYISAMLAYVNLDPSKDVNWVMFPATESMQLLADQQIDAFLALPPSPQALRAKRIGHVLVNSTTDRPWSQYFCCMATASLDFVQRHPEATRRALRALLKAVDICAGEPDRVARTVVDRGFSQNYDSTLQTVRELPYSQWREFDPEDTVRFYTLRMQEVGMIKSTPDKIISRGTNWRFFNELKQELKG